MGAVEKEKQRDSRKRARIRRRNELLQDGLLNLPPQKRNPIARVSCSDSADVKIGERIAVKLDKNLAAVIKGARQVGQVAKVPNSIVRKAGGKECTVGAVVARKHTIGDGFDIEFDS